MCIRDSFEAVAEEHRIDFLFQTEKEHNLNPNDPSDGAKYTLSPEYTNLEMYMNSLVNHLDVYKRQIYGLCFRKRLYMFPYHLYN